MPGQVYSFEGVRNFRDFGDLPTVDGRKVRAGRLFRSANFAKASAADSEKLAALGIDFIVDLRGPDERQAEPSAWPEAGGSHRVLFSDIGYNRDAPHVAFLRDGDLTLDTVNAFMHRAYLEMPFDRRHIALYRDYFENLAKGGSCIVHCAAGKDRTGLACALTLLTLGVEEQHVFDEYERTNLAQDEAFITAVQHAMSRDRGRPIEREVLLPLMGVRPEYLRTSLDAIAARHGQVENYMADVLGVDEARRNVLREHFLE